MNVMRSLCRYADCKIYNAESVSGLRGAARGGAADEREPRR